MTYIGKDGQKHRPYMVHRALLGSLERFFGILTEHYAGQFPLWLAPEQVRVLPISEKYEGYARQLESRLRSHLIRCSVDVEADPIGGKIRRGRNQRIPYLLIVGEREEADGEVSVRSRAKGEEGSVKFEELIARLEREIAEKA